jgi:hypothetical protein
MSKQVIIYLHDSVHQPLVEYANRSETSIARAAKEIIIGFLSSDGTVTMSQEIRGILMRSIVKYISYQEDRIRSANEFGGVINGKEAVEEIKLLKSFIKTISFENTDG